MISLDDATHTYTMDGRVVPSVTQALSVITNLDGIPFDVLERARLFGVHCHRMTELFDRGELDEETLHPELKLYLHQYKNFLYESEFEIVETERIVYNKATGYAGKFDKKSLRKKVSWLIDLKSGAVPRTVGAQTSAYQHAHPEPPKRRGVLQLARDRYRFKELHGSADWPLFVSALNCYRFYSKEMRNQNGNEEIYAGSSVA